MSQTQTKSYIGSILRGFTFVALLSGLLFAFVMTLKSNVDLPLPPVSIVGPPEYYNPEANPIHANIGVTVNSLGNLDLATGIYFMDFYLTIICDRPCEPDLDIINAAVTPEIETLPGDTQNNSFHNYRVRANLLTSVNMANFPFDRQTLALTIGDKRATRDELIFNADPSYSAWNYGQLYALGWLVRPELNVHVVEWSYPYRSGLYSRFIFSATVYRPWTSSFLNYFMPVIIIMLVSFLSFLLKPEAAGERLTLTSSTLVALILFHININSSLPPLTSLTYADKFMLTNYTASAIAVAVSAILLVLRDAKDLTSAQRIHQWTRWLAPLLWASLVLAVTIRHFSQ